MLTRKKFLLGVLSCSAAALAPAVYAQTNDKTLVVYYSWSGNTRQLANAIAKELDTYIYEIEVKKPYPDQYIETLDLVRVQMRKGQLPEIVEDGPNFSEFSTILLGSPIWCGHASRPVMAFLEKYDLSGKVILPFATHGGGGISHYVDDIQTKYPQADIRSAFSSRGSSFSVEQIRDWLKENKLLL